MNVLNTDEEAKVNQIIGEVDPDKKQCDRCNEYIDKKELLTEGLNMLPNNNSLLPLRIFQEKCSGTKLHYKFLCKRCYLERYEIVTKFL